jgi:hypothetical protein
MSIFNFAHISHLRSAANRNLLHRFYHELMVPNFPDADELDVSEHIVATLPYFDMSYHVNVVRMSCNISI